jgi:hypothetical protein
MRVTGAQTDTITDRTDHSAWNALWLLLQDEMQRSRADC